MPYLIIGLILFLGLHSVRVFAEDWRVARIAKSGEGAWKGIYSLASLVGLVLIIYGYGQARQAPIDLWFPPHWTNHITALLMVPVFILLGAANPRASHIKAMFKHPMTLSVKVWAIAHLISNGRLSDVLLFGGFLLWSVFVYRAARQRDRKLGITYAATGWSRDITAVVAGLIIWLVFAFYLHRVLIGVQPFG